MVKLILNGFFISVKQNLNYAWSLEPHILVKLTLNDIYSFFPSIKQNLSHAWLLRPHALAKLILIGIFSKC